MRPFIRKTLTVLSVVADALSIAGAMPTITVLLGLVIAATVGVIAWIEGMPKFFLALGVLGAFLFFAVAGTLVRIWPFLERTPALRGLPAFVAREQYTDLDVRQRLDEVALEQHQIWAQLSVIEMRLDRLRRRNKGVVSNEEQQLRDQAEELTERKEWLDIQVDVAWRGVMASLYAKLRDGVLVASGLALPHEAGKPPREIPAVEWDFLRFDDSMEIASGQGIGYRVVAVRKV